MKLIKTQEAVGHVLCHDLTQIIPGEFKGARFRKGHVVTEEDIPVLLSMGKENLYVWELHPGMLHEDDAAMRLCGLSMGQNIRRTEDIKEGKIELFAECDGYFTVDVEKLNAVNSVPDVMLATRKGGTAVKAGDKLAGMRVIPLVVSETTLEEAEEAAGSAPLLNVLPFKLKTAGIVTTGSEVKKGLIEDKFTPAVKRKLEAVGIETVAQIFSGDGVENVAIAINQVRAKGVDLVLCTGGMSVDPDDNTPGGIKAAGAQIVTYGAPVLPGAMFLLGYFSDGTPVMGLPGCVMFAGATVFDLVLPPVAAGVPVSRSDIVALGNGGLCLGCKPCHWPDCPFGK
ncbi:molybdopterin-binding protein [Oscillibacter valericigenes]|nr:molybdopterin-binding protein [Oscillibacter valericigenes]